MFRLPHPDETFPTQCIIETPQGEKTVDCKITVHFRLLSPERFREATQAGDAAALSALIADWDEIEDEDGKPLPLNEDTIRRVSELPYFVIGVVKSYEERFAPLKNFRAPLAG